MSVLYFHGYQTPEPGDFITVFRGDWCVGNIHWYLSGQIVAALTLGQTLERESDFKAVEEAQDWMLAAFDKWCRDRLLDCTGDSPVPFRCRIDWKAEILAEVRLIETSAEVEKHMRARRIQRRLAEMAPFDRKETRRLAFEYMLGLQAKEQALEAAQ